MFLWARICFLSLRTSVYRIRTCVFFYLKDKCFFSLRTSIFRVRTSAFSVRTSALVIGQLF